MPQTNRTLDITARLRDQFSRQWKNLGSVFRSVLKGSFLLPLKSLVLAFKAVKAVLTGFAVASIAAFAFLKGGQTVNDVLAAAQAMGNLAQSTQTATERLSALSNAFTFRGIEFDDFRGVIVDLGANIGDALSDVNSPQAQAFGRLGITLEQLRTEDYVTILGRIADGVAGIGNETERATALFPLFPEDFQKLLPLLRDGRAELEALVERATRFGGALGAPLARRADAILQSLLQLRLVVQDITRTGIIEGLSQVQPFIDLLAESLADNRQGLVGAVRAAIEVFSKLLVLISKAIIQFGALIAQGIDPLIERITKGLSFEIQLPAINLPFTPTIELPPIPVDIASQIAEGFGFTPFGPVDIIDPATGDVVKRDTAELLRTVQDFARQYVEVRKGIGGPDDVAGSITQQAAELKAALDGAAQIFAQARGAQLAQAGVDQGDIANVTGFGAARDALNSAEIEAVANDLRDIQGLLGTEPFTEPFGPFIEEAEIAREGIAKVQTASVDWIEQFSNGADTILRNWVDLNSAIAEAGATLATSALGGIEDAFSSIILGTKSAKEAFKDLAKGILEDIARLIPRLLILQSLKSLALLAEGGVTSGVAKTLPIKTYARGGVADSPQLAIFGEAGEEAFVPLQGGAIPVRLSGGSRGQFVFAPSITALDAKSVQRLLIEQRQTITSIWENEVAYKSGPRDTLRAGAR